MGKVILILAVLFTDAMVPDPLPFIDEAVLSGMLIKSIVDLKSKRGS